MFAWWVVGPPSRGRPSTAVVSFGFFFLSSGIACWSTYVRSMKLVDAPQSIIAVVFLSLLSVPIKQISIIVLSSRSPSAEIRNPLSVVSFFSPRWPPLLPIPEGCLFPIRGVLRLRPYRPPLLGSWLYFLSAPVFSGNFSIHVHCRHR
jgi:hypothetical protein